MPKHKIAKLLCILKAI